MKKLLILFLCLMPMLVFATEMKSEENDPVGIETTTMKLRSIGYLHSDAVPKRYLAMSFAVVREVVTEIRTYIRYAVTWVRVKYSIKRNYIIFML